MLSSYSLLLINAVIAFLSSSSSKLYSLQIKLILETGLLEFKSILINHPDSFSIPLTISSVFRLIELFIFSKSLKYASKLLSAPIKASLNSTYAGLFLSAHHNWSVMALRLFPVFKKTRSSSNLFSSSIFAISGFLSRTAFGKADCKRLNFS